MLGRVLNGIRHNKGRNPRGYGLPSLVVVLFFVSVLVQTIIGNMTRETTEAKADAAFNIAREHLDTFQVTGEAPNTGNSPHIMNTNRYVISTYTGTVTNPLVQFAFIENDARAAALYDQKIRAYTNVPSSSPIDTFRPEDIRREYPERTLRSGDRMGTGLSTQNIIGANAVRMGTGSSSLVRTVNLEGFTSTIINSIILNTGTQLNADTLSISGNVSVDNMNIGRSLSVEDMSAQGLTVIGDTNGNLATIDTVIQSGQFAVSDELSNVIDLSFDKIDVAGIRIGEVYSENFQSNVILSGEPKTGNIDNSGNGSPYANCLENSGSVFECAPLYDDSITGDETPYNSCIAGGGDDNICGNLEGAPDPVDPSEADTRGEADDVTQNDTEEDSGINDPIETPYDICIAAGGAEAVCSTLEGGSNHNPDLDIGGGASSPYEVCVQIVDNPLDCTGLSGAPDTDFEICIINNDNIFTCAPLHVAGETEQTIYELCLLEGESVTSCSSLWELNEVETVDAPFVTCIENIGIFSTCNGLPGQPVDTFTSCIDANGTFNSCVSEYDAEEYGQSPYSFCIGTEANLELCAPHYVFVDDGLPTPYMSCFADNLGGTGLPQDICAPLLLSGESNDGSGFLIDNNISDGDQVPSEAGLSFSNQEGTVSTGNSYDTCRADGKDAYDCF